MAAVVDSFDAIFEAATEAGAVIAVPGLLNWLGYTPRSVDSDYRDSLDGGFTEGFEDYCARISKETV